MDAHHRQAAALENLIPIMIPALSFVFINVIPLLISPPGDLNPTSPAPGMTPTAFQAIRIPAQCFWPLNTLGLVSALAALFVLVVGATVRLGYERVSLKFLKISILSTLLSFECLVLIRLSPHSLLSFECLVLIRLSPHSLLSGLCIFQGVMMLVSLCIFCLSVANY